MKISASVNFAQPMQALGSVKSSSKNNLLKASMALIATLSGGSSNVLSPTMRTSLISRQTHLRSLSAPLGFKQLTPLKSVPDQSQHRQLQTGFFPVPDEYGVGSTFTGCSFFEAADTSVGGGCEFDNVICGGNVDVGSSFDVFDSVFHGDLSGLGGGKISNVEVIGRAELSGSNSLSDPNGRKIKFLGNIIFENGSVKLDDFAIDILDTYSYIGENDTRIFPWNTIISSDRITVEALTEYPPTISPVMLETSAPMASPTALPVLSETDMPVAVQTPAPLVLETPSPIAPETDMPVAVRTPAPFVLETPSPIDIDTNAPTQNNPTFVPRSLLTEAPVIQGETLAPSRPATSAPTFSDGILEPSSQSALTGSPSSVTRAPVPTESPNGSQSPVNNSETSAAQSKHSFAPSASTILLFTLVGTQALSMVLRTQ